MTCLFCKEALDGSDEHIILNAIGGRKSSKLLACRGCNTRLGSTIDDDYLKALEFFTLIIDPPTRRRSNGATKRLLDDKGFKYGLAAGGKIKVRYEQIAPNQWVADASESARVDENMRRMSAAHEARTGERPEIAITREARQPGPFALPMMLDNFTALREGLKWVVELLGMHVLTCNSKRKNALLIERAFVSNGGNAPLGGYLDRSLVPYMFDGLEHYVLAVQSADGSVYWESSSYGGAIALAGRTGIMDTQFSPIMYRVDPVTGNHATESPVVTAPNDRCWWLPTYADICQQRTGIAGKRMEHLMNGRFTVSEIIDDCMALHWPTGSTLTVEMVSRLSHCIAEQYVARLRQSR